MPSALKIRDLRLQAPLQVKLLGKGRKHRACPLWPETVAAVGAYLRERRPASPDVSHLFVNALGRPITRFGIRYIVRKYAAKASGNRPSLADKKVSPHVLRHTCAMSVLEATGDIRKVSLWLGHASITTTQVYLRADPNEKLAIVEALVPPKLRRGRFKASDELITLLTGA